MRRREDQWMSNFPALSTASPSPTRPKRAFNAAPPRMGMLSRAGQSVIRPTTPSTPPSHTTPLLSPSCSVGAELARASLPDETPLHNPPVDEDRCLPPVTALPKADSAKSAMGSVVVDEKVSSRKSPVNGETSQPGFTKDAVPEVRKSCIRRRTSTLNRRRLTVEATSKRLIDDYIDRACHSGENAVDASCETRRHPAQEIQTPGAVISVWGSATTASDRFVPFFAHKRMNFDGEFSTMRHRVGIMSHRGYKPESPNQDDFFVLARSDSLLLGILDGHGPDGHVVSHCVQEMLPMNITEHLRQDGEDWTRAVRSSVRDLCTHLRTNMGDAAEYSGTTATIAMLDQMPGSAVGGPMRLRGAFLGDSIAVWARRKSKTSQWEVTNLTNIHRPDREDELERIKLAGGSVRFSSGRSASRLITPEWNLAMSRSVGDFHALPYGLSSEPEISAEMQLEPEYEHLILACSDGVWDVIDVQQAVKFVGRFSPDEAQLAVERLVSKAQRRWQETEDVVDDITAVLVWPGFEEEIGEAID